MPTPARTSVDGIVAAGRRIVEAEGLDALTLQAVAQAVGVRPPSLYKRIGGRGDLIHRISNQVAAELGDRLDAAARTGDARSDIRAMALVTREFARANPQAYGLLFATIPEDQRADADLNIRVSTAILHAAGELVGAEDLLPAARTIVAWLHGFVTMELAGAFRLGSDLDPAFDYGIERILAGLSAGPSQRSRAAPPPTATTPSRRTRTSA